MSWSGAARPPRRSCSGPHRTFPAGRGHTVPPFTRMHWPVIQRAWPLAMNAATSISPAGSYPVGVQPATRGALHERHRGRLCGRRRDLLALASALQHQAATGEQGYRRGIHLLWRLARNRRWAAGLAAAAAGVILHAAALHAGALAAVQPVLLTSLALALPVRALLDRARPSAG